MPELKRVITAFGNRIAMEETLEASLRQIFGSRPVPTDATPRAVEARGEPTQRLAAQALEHFARAREHFGKGNWSGFAEQLKQLEDVLRRMQQEPRR